MTFNEYQKLAIDTKVYRDEVALEYVTIGLCGEVGEVAEKVKKIIRGDYSLESQKSEIVKELGDVLWYVCAFGEELGVSFDQIAETNIAKLSSRKERGQLQGDGDNR